ncbi:DDB1- and CUL4-associated factor 17-like [Dreissena polymorpha]|uniref:DDB1- and CUL4-associated factor 17-like n=1 Tax=Dreissena polymorpha TaxID=45954 RepID=UPI0022656A96|nr:DDB1- and CUL4-associated factor 17-like [Dreissena polymorpha]XP_052285368.1 DDB1- and CUL4-associated factor 17-like [Dreissena polymorpha]XP_052285369.1 DDB1- and CUL4-associated factor 17-like [Dreissena polymorpha]
MSQNLNVIILLRKREIYGDKYTRENLKCLRTLVVKGNRKFQKVWSKRSKTSFHYESGRLLTSNYHECFYGYGKGASPRKVFSVMGPKTEDALIYSCFHDNFHLTENRPWLITLQSHTVGECLQVCDLDTGRCDRQIFLSPVIRFKYLAWAEPNTVFFVKSVNLAYRPRFPMFNAIGSVVLAVFSAFPLQFVGMLEIDKQVRHNCICYISPAICGHV